MSKYDALIEKIVALGNGDDRISAIMMIGSQAREEMSADEYSDLDLIIVVQDTDFFINSNDWLLEIGQYHIVFVEKTIDGASEKRVLFENALDIDFVIITENDAKFALVSGESEKILRKGYRVLIDKKEISSSLPQEVQSVLNYNFPSEIDYVNVVNDFWYHAIWTAKKLLRGELWATKFCLDSYMKYKILWMIEFYEHTKKGPEYNTWYSGRFIDSWADDDIRQQLSVTFAHYEKQDMVDALEKTMALFRYLAIEVATTRGYSYPIDVDNYSSTWVEQNLQ